MRKSPTLLILIGLAYLAAHLFSLSIDMARLKAIVESRGEGIVSNFLKNVVLLEVTGKFFVSSLNISTRA